MAFTAEALRRLVTGEDADGRSLVIIEGGPSATAGAGGGGLFEIWCEHLQGLQDPAQPAGQGPPVAQLCPPPGAVRVRWFVVSPIPEGMSEEDARRQARSRFEAYGALARLTDQSRHPAMHRTETLDVICLIDGSASLVLDMGERRLKPGDVVIQRGTSHAWRAHGGPALFLAVLIDRSAGQVRDTQAREAGL